MVKLAAAFFRRDVLEVAPGLIGSYLCRLTNDGLIKERITEVEAYRGEEDLACHARTGKTKRTEVMYREGGVLYVYLIYGMYWMLNVVTGKTGQPQAVLIRETEHFKGPGILTREMKIDGHFNGEQLIKSERIWIEKGDETSFETLPRIGIDYAGDYWKNVPWRYRAK